MNVLVLGRSWRGVEASAAIIKANGYDAVGVVQDEEAWALLDTGRFNVVVVGTGVEFASREPVRRHAAPHGTVVLEARRAPLQTVEDHVRTVIVPQLHELKL